MDKNQLLTTAGETFAFVENYIENKIEVFKLDIAEKGARNGANLIAIVIVAVAGLFALGCFSVAFAIWIGSIMDNYALAFLLTGILHLIICGTLYLLRQKLLARPLVKNLVKQLFKS